MVARNNEWVVDSGATKHICGDKNAFYDYIQVMEGEEQVFMGNSRPAPVIGKGKVLLKLTSGKTHSLSNVVHVLDIRHNLVFVYVLSKARVRVSFDGENFVLTKNRMFVGKRYCSNELLMLNILNVVMNNNASSSAYIVDSIDLWHGRLCYVNFSYIKKIKESGLLSNFSISEIEKCDVYIESKSTKKSCKPVERET